MRVTEQDKNDYYWIMYSQRVMINRCKSLGLVKNVDVHVLNELCKDISKYDDKELMIDKLGVPNKYSL